MDGNIIIKHNSNLLRAFVNEARQAQAKVASGPPRLIFAMDATVSRQPTWDLACEIQVEMFNAAAKVGKLEVQLVWFRGEREFTATPFVASAGKLARLMDGITCRAGHTQMGHVLRHTQAETMRGPVAGLIYVGDTTEEPHMHLIRQAEAMGVRAFVFHESPDENPHAVRTFSEIARITGGVYLPFDRNSAKELAGLLSAIGTFAAGGVAALERQDTAAARLLLSHLK